MRKQDNFFSRHMVILPMLISWVLGIAILFVPYIYSKDIIKMLLIVPMGEFVGTLIIYPFILTFLEGIFLFTVRCGDLLHKRERYVDIITLVLGFVYTIFYVLFRKK